MPTISIMKDGFRKPLRRLKPHKASGPNKLPTGLPKTDEITSLPTLVFQISLQQGRTSTDWRDWNIATVTPSFNKGDKRNPSNYRSVSWNTLYTAPLCSSLTKHSILTDMQHGFCNNDPANLNWFLSSTTWPKGQMITQRLIQFSLIFQGIWQSTTPAKSYKAIKLHLNGICDPTLSLIDLFLFISNRTQHVAVERVFSDVVSFILFLQTLYYNV